MGRRLSRAAVTVAVGLTVGCLTSFGQTLLVGASAALVNSASAWLVAPFAVGACMASLPGAALAGLTVCVMQLVGYDVTASLRGFATSGSLALFWVACGVLGGPLFGAGGRLWRRGDRAVRGVGPALLCGAFVAEGLWLYLHELHYYADAVLWLAIGAAVAATLVRGIREYRWVAVTLPGGLVGEIVLTRIHV